MRQGSQGNANGMRGALDNVAHDFRTPLARIHGIAEFALQSEPNLELSQEALADCMEEADRLRTMRTALAFSSLKRLATPSKMAHVFPGKVHTVNRHLGPAHECYTII